MIYLGYLLAVFMGTVLGLIGGGGSILTVPILVYVMGVNATLATAYSLFVVGLSAAVASWDYHKRNLIDYKIGTIFAIPAFVGVYLVRRYLIPNLPEQMGQFLGMQWTKDSLILVVFAIVMLVASGMMIRGRKEVDGLERKSPPFHWVTLEGLLVGGLTGFVGAGGGFMIIPALVLLVGLPMKTAVGTSLFIITIKSLIGFLGDVQTTAELDWHLLGLFSLFSVGGIFLGARLSRKVDNKTLKPLFGWFVLVMGILMLLKETLF